MPSVALAGHFYMYDTLHLTEISRNLDSISVPVFDRTHAETQHTLILMLALLPLDKSRGQCKNTDGSFLNALLFSFIPEGSDRVNSHGLSAG